MSRILIIDDQAPIRRVLRDILENETYQVEDVGSGMEALQVIKEQEFDAIFCDIKCQKWTVLRCWKPSSRCRTRPLS